jgi:lipoprotein-releasing system permease protein
MLPQYERKVSDLLQTVTLGSAAAIDAPASVETGVSPVQAGSKTRPSTTASDSPDDLTSVHQRQAAMPPIILGHDMAEEIGATVGSVVLVTSPQGELTPFGMVPKYIRLSDAQELFGLGDVISVIQFKIDDIYQAAGVAHQLEQSADLISGSHGFMATNWMEQNKPLFRALRLERVVTFITIGLIVFVAALNILISLIMMVMEKTKDIAVLMSLGTKKKQIRRVFIAQGVLIGVIGTVIGLILGYAISYAGGHYHFIALSAEVYSIDYVPFAPRLIDGLIVALVSIGISFIATIYPSWSAARILPAEALRYE